MGTVAWTVIRGLRVIGAPKVTHLDARHAQQGSTRLIDFLGLGELRSGGGHRRQLFLIVGRHRLGRRVHGGRVEGVLEIIQRLRD